MTKRAKRPRKVITLRRIIQAAFVTFALFVGARHLWMGSGPTGAPSFDAYCPFGGVETLWRFITTGTFLRKLHPSNLILLAATLVTALLTGRAFCGWICPLGSVQEWLANLSRKLTGGRRAWLPLKMPPAIDKPLRYLKYLILGGVLWNSVSAVVPPLEPFCPYKTLFHFELNSLISWSIFSIVIIGSLLVERFWCKYFCPLGAILAPFNKFSLIQIATDENACISCGLCERACGMGIEGLPENIHHPECIRCLDCLDVCPRPGALELQLPHSRTERENTNSAELRS